MSITAAALATSCATKVVLGLDDETVPLRDPVEVGHGRPERDQGLVGAAVAD